MRCSSCTGRFHPIPPSGPQPCSILALAERPGQWEEANARRGYTGYHGRTCLIGPTGVEFDETYLPRAGIHRADLRVGNVVRCGAENNRKPSPEEIRACSAHFLPEELAQTNPQVVMLMGGSAVKLIPGCDLNAEHGVPRKGKLFDWEGWIVPMYHPARGLHDGNDMIPLLEDFEQLKPWFSSEYQEWPWPVDSTKRDYRWVETGGPWKDILVPFYSIPWIGADTESQYGIPYSIQFSLGPGLGTMARISDKQAIADCRYLLNSLMSNHEVKSRESKGLVFHAAQADLDIFRDLGFKTDVYRDTYLEAYHFGRFLHLGLKILSKRLLGRGRLSWEETVTPYSKQVLAEWMMAAIDYEEGKRSVVSIGKSGKPVKPKITVSEAEYVLRDVFQYMNRSEEYNPWEKLVERLPPMELARLIEERPMPKLGIAHCPPDVQLEYGCSDADDTLQLAHLLDRMRKEFEAGLNLSPEDVD